MVVSRDQLDDVRKDEPFSQILHLGIGTFKFTQETIKGGVNELTNAGVLICKDHSFVFIFIHKKFG